MSTPLTHAELIKLLKVQFPKVWIKDGGEFDSRHKGTLWTGEGSYIETADGYMIDAFSMHTMSGYIFGVANQLDDFLTTYGWHAEAYDSGTFFLYRD